MLLRYVAQVSVGPSTTQSYKRADSNFHYADFLARLNLASLASKDEAQFAAWLNGRSTALSRKIVPTKNPGVSTWGMARKILNIFLHNVYYTRILSDTYNLNAIEDYLEVPLDSHVVTWLLRIAESTYPEIEFENPIKGPFAVYKVDPATNKKFQQLANQAAKQLNTKRVYLDTYLYRADETLWILRDRID